MNILRKMKEVIKAGVIYSFDFKNEKRYSTLITDRTAQQEMLLSAMVVDAHTIEKGLTMPQKRYPFGEAKARTILNDCNEYVKRGYNLSEPRFLDIVSIMKEYRDVHIQHGQIVEDINEQTDKLLQIIHQPVNNQQLYSVSREDYFSHSNDNFPVFSNSRHSCRNLPGHVSDERLKAALALSMNVPSTCNRQSHRVHLLQSDKAKRIILSIQHGCRGFGNIVDQFILITSDLNCWEGGKVRHAPYLDGGIYLMNLLYSLHHEQIAACTLNMYLDKNTTMRMHKLLHIPNNEVPVALIAIGIPPEKFDLARSHRRKFEEITQIH